MIFANMKFWRFFLIRFCVFAFAIFQSAFVWCIWIRFKKKLTHLFEKFVFGRIFAWYIRIRFLLFFNAFLQILTFFKNKYYFTNFARCQDFFLSVLLKSWYIFFWYHDGFLSFNQEILFAEIRQLDKVDFSFCWN